MLRNDIHAPLIRSSPASVDHVEDVLPPEGEVVGAGGRDDTILLLSELHGLAIPLRDGRGCRELDGVPHLRAQHADVAWASRRLSASVEQRQKQKQKQKHEHENGHEHKQKEQKHKDK